jgi:CRP-like cAMP-binding protein
MPYGTTPVARQLEQGKPNRFLAALPPHDFSLLAPHLRTIPLERGVMLHDVGEEIEHVYFPHTGMVSLVAVMQSGATVETATIGRGGVIGASAGLGARWTFGRAVVQLPGAAAWLSATQFRAAANESQAVHDLVVRYRICCWRKFNSRSPATRSMRSRPGFAAGCCKRTIASTAMRSR